MAKFDNLAEKVTDALVGLINEIVSEGDYSDIIQEKVDDAIGNYDFKDDINNAIDNAGLPNEESVRDIANEEAEKHCETAEENIQDRLQEMLDEYTSSAEFRNSVERICENFLREQFKEFLFGWVTTCKNKISSACSKTISFFKP